MCRSKNRPSFDDTWIGVAELISKRATCNRLQVGAVIVKNNKIIGVGYNGSPSGDDHCFDVGCMINQQGRCVRTVHAEANAIIDAGIEKTEGSVLYCTHKPCESCSSLIKNAKISRVVYIHEYENEFSDKHLSGIIVEKYKSHFGDESEVY